MSSVGLGVGGVGFGVGGVGLGVGGTTTTVPPEPDSSPPSLLQSSASTTLHLATSPFVNWSQQPSAVSNMEVPTINGLSFQYEG